MHAADVAASHAVAAELLASVELEASDWDCRRERMGMSILASSAAVWWIGCFADRRGGGEGRTRLL